jgi:hypothetical protein
MVGTPPTPETSVSLFVWVFVLLSGLVVVLTLLVVRRRRQALLNVTLGFVAMAVLVLSALFLIVPPRMPAKDRPLVGEHCPYDRMIWSNMPRDVDEAWQPCRRAARAQLVLMLLGSSAVTVAAAVVALNLKPPRREDAAVLVSAGVDADGD